MIIKLLLKIRFHDLSKSSKMQFEFDFFPLNTNQTRKETARPSPYVWALLKIQFFRTPFSEERIWPFKRLTRFSKHTQKLRSRAPTSWLQIKFLASLVPILQFLRKKRRRRERERKILALLARAYAKCTHSRAIARNLVSVAWRSRFFTSPSPLRKISNYTTRDPLSNGEKYHFPTASVLWKVSICNSWARL